MMFDVERYLELDDVEKVVVSTAHDWNVSFFFRFILNQYGRTKAQVENLLDQQISVGFFYGGKRRAI